MNREALGLVLIRVFMGGWFLWAGIPKLKTAFRTEQLAGMLQYFAEQGAFSFYKGFLAWAAGHTTLFGYLTSWGEVATGLALIFGFATPLASVAAIFMCLNYFLATQGLGPAPIGLNLFCVVAGISLLVGRAGRYFGLDSKIWK